MTNSSELRTTTSPQEAPMQASKWLKCPLLISGNEMAQLILSLKPFFIYTTGSITPQGESEISIDTFLMAYQEYSNALAKGEIPEESKYRQLFSSILTNSLEALFALLINDEKQLIRLSKPVVQMQPHRLHYSSEDQSFRSLSYGTDGIQWGILFSYPQLYQDPHSKEIMQVDQQFSNTALFRNLQRWTRDNTIPAPFLIGDKQINIPARLGKECLSWINMHPQLQAKGLSIKT